MQWPFSHIMPKTPKTLEATLIGLTVKICLTYAILHLLKQLKVVNF